MGVAYFIALDNKEPGFDTLVNGKAVAREHEAISKITNELKLPDINDLTSFAALAEEFGIDPDSEAAKEKWFYVSPQVRPSCRRWPWRMLSVVGVLLLLALASPFVSVRRVESRIDPVTGSVTRNTVWLFGITSGPRPDVSPLEARLKSSGISWTPSWQFLHKTHYNLFGGATCHGCGSAPAIFELRPLLQQFAAASTDSDLRQFVRVMQSGTPAEHRAAVEAAAEIAIQSASAAPPG